MQNILNARGEWLLARASGKTFVLQKSEIEIEITKEKLFINFFDDKGLQTWRIADYKIENENIKLELTRNFAKENEKITLAPRVSAGELKASVEIARLEKAGRIAALIVADDTRRRLLRVRLNEENGRFGQIVFEQPNKIQIAALADVTDALTAEILLSAAILHLVKLQNRRKNPVDEIWILAAAKMANNLQKLHALLRENWKTRIKISEISCPDGKEEKPNAEKTLIEKPKLSISDLWRGKASALKLPPRLEISLTAREIIELAPDEIDVIVSRNGETLRFLGLPFARIRKVFDREKVWFGIEKSPLLLIENNLAEFGELIENLRVFRRFDSPNTRHEFYRRAPEAWLESMLRRNIKLLDANLVLSPLYHQFRAGREQIDLLALRRDGRLVIVELKVAPDREMMFQAIDYWRKIELQRRKGNLNKARLFGELQISAQPTIVYLAAPTLAFHRDYDFLARTISDEIEIHRFNLAGKLARKSKGAR